MAFSVFSCLELPTWYRELKTSLGKWLFCRHFIFVVLNKQILNKRLKYLLNKVSVIFMLFIVPNLRVNRFHLVWASEMRSKFVFSHNRITLIDLKTYPTFRRKIVVNWYQVWQLLNISQNCCFAFQVVLLSSLCLLSSSWGNWKYVFRTWLFSVYYTQFLIRNYSTKNKCHVCL